MNSCSTNIHTNHLGTIESTLAFLYEGDRFTEQSFIPSGIFTEPFWETSNERKTSLPDFDNMSSIGFKEDDPLTAIACQINGVCVALNLSDRSNNRRSSEDTKIDVCHPSKTRRFKKSKIRISELKLIDPSQILQNEEIQLLKEIALTNTDLLSRPNKDISMMLNRFNIICLTNQKKEYSYKEFQKLAIDFQQYIIIKDNYSSQISIFAFLTLLAKRVILDNLRPNSYNDEFENCKIAFGSTNRISTLQRQYRHCKMLLRKNRFLQFTHTENSIKK